MATPIAKHSTSDASQPWCLRLINGTLAGSVWPLSDSALLIGRSLGCHVCIEDASVSRVQCEIDVRDGIPHLWHRSHNTPTLHNNAPVTDTRLQLGDLIEFAGYRFVIDAGLSTSSASVPSAEPVPTTQRFEDSIYLNSSADTDASNFARDIISLFTLQRSLARSDSLDALVERLRTHVREQLPATECWLAWCIGAEGDLAVYPPVSSREQAQVPVSALQQAFASQDGLLFNAHSDENTMVAAPLLHGGVAFGAVVAQRPRQRGEYNTVHLHYLLAVAEGAAPLIRAAERMEQLQRDRQWAAQARVDSAQLLGSSRMMSELRDSLARTAMARGNVMLLGETGVGKELAARTIHDLGPRADGPYVVVNCAAIPDELFESELFGHERGSFTGATQARKGLFELAHGGTLFLDEVGELSLANQARLLRATENNEIRRIGGDKDLAIDVRIVSATNRPVMEEGQTFRSDLFYRLGGLVLWLPPLREHPEDIPELAHHFLNHFASYATAHPTGFTEDALDAMARYRWPGNVRELRNVIERACYTATSHLIGRDDLVPLGTLPVARAVPSAPGYDDRERKRLLDALRANGANVAQTAEALGMATSTLYYRLRRHKINLRNPS